MRAELLPEYRLVEDVKHSTGGVWAAAAASGLSKPVATVAGVTLWQRENPFLSPQPSVAPPSDGGGARERNPFLSSGGTAFDNPMFSETGMDRSASAATVNPFMSPQPSAGGAEELGKPLDNPFAPVVDNPFLGSAAAAAEEELGGRQEATRALMRKDGACGSAARDGVRRARHAEPARVEGCVPFASCAHAAAAA